MLSKTCTKCGVSKRVSEFYSDPRKADGLRPWCKECFKQSACAVARCRTAEQRATNRRKYGEVRDSAPYIPRADRSAAATVRRQAQREAAEARWQERRSLPLKPSVGSREWYASASPAEIEIYRRNAREKSRVRYAADPDAGRARQQWYKHANPDVVKRWQGRRAALAAERSDGTLTASVIRRMFSETKTCIYDGLPLDGRGKALDHMNPLSRGGAHSAINVVVCCRDCNLKKGARPFAEWVASLSEVQARRSLKLYRSRYGCAPGQATMPFAFGQSAAAPAAA